MWCRGERPLSYFAFCVLIRIGFTSLLLWLISAALFALSLSLCWLNWFFAVLKGVWLESRVRTALGRRLANCECRAGVVRGCHRTAVYWPRCRPCRCRAERCCRPAEVTGARAPPSHRCLSPPHSRTLACQHSGPLAKSLPMVWRRKKAYKLLVSAVAKNSLTLTVQMFSWAGTVWQVATRGPTLNGNLLLGGSGPRI